jgi:hypothetical protein
MRGYFYCHHCGKSTRLNPRLKGEQKYCSEKECRKASRRVWKKQQYTNNDEYREKTKEDQKRWRAKTPANQYQKNYRDTHPDYVNTNRKLQKVRNKKRVTTVTSTVINPSSLILQFRADGSYLLSRVQKDIMVDRYLLSPEALNN